jgi:hypothetical protein
MPLLQGPNWKHSEYILCIICKLLLVCWVDVDCDGGDGEIEERREAKKERRNALACGGFRKQGENKSVSSAVWEEVDEKEWGMPVIFFVLEHGGCCRVK